MLEMGKFKVVFDNDGFTWYTMIVEKIKAEAPASRLS